MNTKTIKGIKTPFWQKVILIISGVLLGLVFIEAGLRLGGFTLTSSQELKNRASLAQKSEYRILCLGESTTQSQYPLLLEKILNERNIGIKFSVIDKGLAATKTWLIVSQLESYMDTYRPDMVITMMGINDNGAHMPYEPFSESTIGNFLRSFKVYKLTRLLWLHIVNKVKEHVHNSVYEKKKVVLTDIKPAKSKETIKSSAKSDKVFFDLGVLYYYQGKFSDAEVAFKKAIELNAKNARAYLSLGIVYSRQRRIAEAEEALKRSIEIDSDIDEAYIELGKLHMRQGKFSDAENSLRRAVELNPKNARAYHELGRVYIRQNRFFETEEAFKRSIEFNPKSSEIYLELGQFYIKQRKFFEAEELFKKAIEINPGNDRIYGALELLAAEMGDHELAGEYGKMARELRLKYYEPNTVASYHKLKTILGRMGVAYVCVQYPMRNLEPLKKIFQDDDKGVIFVDNESVFRSAVAKHGYENYFNDRFGGEFGHCTKEGNRLLAENIAGVILEKLFSGRGDVTDKVK